VFIKILTYFEQKMHRDQNMVSFCSQYNTSVSQFLEKLKSLFISRSTSLTSEIDLPGFCALWKQFVVEFGIRQAADPNIDIEASHLFHVVDTSGNSYIDFAELLFFMSEQCVTLLQKSSQERKKIEDLLLQAAQNQDQYGTPPVLGEYTTRQFLQYAWACFQKLASTQKRDPVHFECSKQEFSQLWDELKHQLGFGNEDPSMHIDQVYPHIDRDDSGTISAAEMIEGLIKHFLPRAEASRSQSKAPSSGPSGRGIMTRDLVKGADASASRPPKRPSVTPGSPSTGRLNPADSKLLTKIREEPWYKLAQDEFDSIGEHSIDADDFSAIITRMFEKKKIPILSPPTLEFMFRTFDTNGYEKLSKTEFLCGIWRTLAFADAAAQCCDDEDDEDLGGEWEGDHMQYLRLAVVPFSQNTMLSVDRLHNMFNEMLELQCTQQGTAWRPSSTLVSLFQRHKLILDSLEQLEYEIDQEHQHIMKDIGQPGKTVDWDSMLAKISTCSFGLVLFLIFACF
jgi:Ca2+-binding EF-hand superfamily protein